MSILMKTDCDRDKFPNQSTVYGPITSWRFGQSLGIDPIFETSTCSFNCIYCQLGEIQNITRQFKIYVKTQRVLEDFKQIMSQGKKIDVITYSGSGEPSLAANLGEIVTGFRAIASGIPQFILTNATELGREEVRLNLKQMDKVIVKIDAANEEMFQKMNRPAKGITLDGVIKGILQFKEVFQGQIEVQTMFMPMNQKEIEGLANILKQVDPSVVQLNTPKRPYPLSWHRENRGNHLGIFDYAVSKLKSISKSDAESLKDQLEKLTGLTILSVYH